MGWATADRLDVGALRAFLRRRPQAPPGDRCGLCVAPLLAGHRHVVDVEEGGVRCACTACRLLMQGGGHRFAVVPERVLHDPAVALTDAHWRALQIPVACAFVVRRRRDPHPVAIHPSPAGPTETPLEARAWDAIVAANPWMAGAHDDVEAVLLVDRPEPGRPREALLVPIDRCYAMVGIVRSRWRGFDGGPEVQDGIDEVLDHLRRDAASAARRSEGIAPGHGAA